MEAIANAEASNTASTVPPSMKIEESNDPQVLGRSVGLQKSMGRILRLGVVRKGSGAAIGRAGARGIMT